MRTINKWKQLVSIGLPLLLFLGISYSSLAQSSNLPLNRDYNALFDTDPELISSGFHSSIRPYLRSDVIERVDLDSILLEATPKFMRFALGEDSVQWKSSFELYPTFALGYGTDLVSGKQYQVTGIGLSGIWNLGEKFTVAGVYNTGNRGFANYVDSFITENEVVPGLGYALTTKEGYAYSNFEGYVSYSPSEHFNFQIGQGKNFFGNGYRSLLLSDVANNYPFFKINTSVWNIKYTNLFTIMYDVQGSGGNNGAFKKKYGSFHYLSWNATRWLNISLFESIVWAGADSSGVRGYDVNYLNPIIFYRPVEFSLGSSDNAVIGTNISAKVTKSILLYGQVVLDEFFLVHVRAGDGWWANKQGFQLGVKAWDLFKVDGLSLLLEYNRVRPFTYSHGLRIQNYSHFNQALAHPLGANFYETTSFLRYTKGPYAIEGSFMYAVKGFDSSSGASYGGNIFTDYLTPRAKEFDNFIGQGVNTTIIIGGIRAAYLIYPPTNLKLEMGVNVRSSTSSVDNVNSTLFTIGLKTDLGNTYHDF